VEAVVVVVFRSLRNVGDVAAAWVTEGVIARRQGNSIFLLVEFMSSSKT